MTIPCPEPRGYPGNLGSLLAAHATSDRTAIVDLRDAAGPQPVSFRELDAGCNAVARGLARAGLKPRDRIGILSLNRVEFVMVVLGAMRAGVVPVPVNVKLPAEGVGYILEDAGARQRIRGVRVATSGAGRDPCSGLRRGLPRFSRSGSVRSFRAGAGLGCHSTLHIGLDRPPQGRAALPLRPELEPVDPRAHARHERKGRDPRRRAALSQECVERDQAGTDLRRAARH